MLGLPGIALDALAHQVLGQSEELIASAAQSVGDIAGVLLKPRLEFMIFICVQSFPSSEVCEFALVAGEKIVPAGVLNRPEYP